MNTHRRLCINTFLFSFSSNFKTLKIVWLSYNISIRPKSSECSERFSICLQCQNEMNKRMCRKRQFFSFFFLLVLNFAFWPNSSGTNSGQYTRLFSYLFCWLCCAFLLISDKTVNLVASGFRGSKYSFLICS